MMWSNPAGMLPVSPRFEITGLNNFPQKSVLAPLAVLCPRLAWTSQYITTWLKHYEEHLISLCVSRDG